MTQKLTIILLGRMLSTNKTEAMLMQTVTVQVKVHYVIPDF